MKIAVLKVKEKSAWQSCQTISRNLEAVYTRLGKHPKMSVEFVPYFKRKMENSALRIFEDLRDRQVTRIVIIDHFPYPGTLFTTFARVFEELDYYPEIYVHTYGCIMHWFHELDHKAAFFSKCRIHLIVASQAQKQLLTQYLKTSVSVSVINFPLDTDVFRPLKNRAALRKELGFAEDDVILIYTGRAHVQKNLPLLIRSVGEVMRSNPKIKFLFAGNYDDSAVNFLEYRYAYGANQAMVKAAVKEAGIESQFRELGSLGQADLVRYLSAADIFCSLSMYNDEDYGYAPLEALSCGCAALLSAWAGYKEFDSPFTAFVKVRREYVNKLDSLYLSPIEVQTRLQELLQKLPVNREELARNIAERFSIPAVAEQVLDLHMETEPKPIEFRSREFLQLKKIRLYPLHRYAYLSIYQSYYR